MTAPNLFEYATKELSQDAIICWLIAYAGTTKSRDQADEALQQCGRTFVEALFAKWEDFGEVELGNELRVEIEQQDHNIDVLARINGRHVLLVEDKTETGAHDGQLERYWQLVIDGHTAFESVTDETLYPIYLKTGNLSLGERRRIEVKEGYRVFDRADFLRVLDTYKGRNAILVDFRHYLTQWEEETRSFERWTSEGGQWTKEDANTQLGWEGLYEHVERALDGSADSTGGITNMLHGGYTGVWLEPRETSESSRFAMWIEKEKVSFRLYGAKTKCSTKGMNREKQKWANVFVERGEGRFVKPRRLKATATKPMCVSEWRPSEAGSWLAFGSDGRFDTPASVRNIEWAANVLRTAITSEKR